MKLHERMIVGAVMVATLIAGIVACHVTSPPVSKRYGLDINNVNSTGSQLVEQGLFEWNKNWSDGTDSGGSLSEIIVDGIGPGPLTIPISQCQFETQASLTGSQTTYATIYVYKRPGNNPDGGVGPTLIAAASTTLNQADAAADAASTGSWFAYQNVVVPAVVGAYVSPGDQITVAIAKASTGVGVPQGILTCYTTIN